MQITGTETIKNGYGQAFISPSKGERTFLEMVSDILEFVAQKISELREVSIEEIAKKTF